jgi:hypothetical protein
VAEARAKTDRARREAERELAALTHRRDSINAQAAAGKPGAPAPTPTGRSGSVALSDRR